MFSPAAVAALALFVIAYGLFAVFERYRVAIAAAGAAILLAVGWVTWTDLEPTGWSGSGGVIEWNAVALLAGLLLFSGLLGALGFFRWVSFRLIERTGERPLRLFFVLAGLAFVLSAFINSIAVMLVLAAVTFEVTRHSGQDPVPLLLAEISAANIGGAATYVGDLPNVILGTYGNLSFEDFLLHTGPPAAAALLVALWAFSRSVDRTPRPAPSVPPIAAPAIDRVWLGTAFGAFGVMIAMIAVAPWSGVPIWVIGVAGGLAALAIGGAHHLRPLLLALDLEMIAFFLFLFILVGGLETTGAIAGMAGGIASVGTGNLLVTGSLLLWSLGLLSSVVNNVPLATAAGPLIARVGVDSGLPTSPLIYATAIGTDIGGNGTPIGASANVVALTAARRAGVTITWGTYLRRAFPIMLVSLAVSNVVWLVIH
jgi:Na+/H+ antiporter NhaD/arsenite permease-like protein